jgi:hypothetical protein
VADDIAQKRNQRSTTPATRPRRQRSPEDIRADWREKSARTSKNNKLAVGQRMIEAYDELATMYPHLQPLDRWNYLSIVRHSNKDRKCRPSQTRLAALAPTGTCRETISRSTKRLEACGLVRKTPGSGHSATVYNIQIPRKTEDELLELSSADALQKQSDITQRRDLQVTSEVACSSRQRRPAGHTKDTVKDIRKGKAPVAPSKEAAAVSAWVRHGEVAHGWKTDWGPPPGKTGCRMGQDDLRSGLENARTRKKVQQRNDPDVKQREQIIEDMLNKRTSA